MLIKKIVQHMRLQIILGQDFQLLKFFKTQTKLFRTDSRAYTYTSICNVHTISLPRDLNNQKVEHHPPPTVERKFHGKFFLKDEISKFHGELKIFEICVQFQRYWELQVQNARTCPWKAIAYLLLYFFFKFCFPTNGFCQ